MKEISCDILIIGGGLAGLSLSILCAKKNYKVIVLEKSQYPRHKVCGEYISKESLDFLKELNFDFQKHKLPEINTFVLSSEYSKNSSCSLNPGGIGISRYLIDDELSKIAKENGVEIFCNEKFIDYKKENESFLVNSNQFLFKTSLLIDASGRKSNSYNKKENKTYIGVKYHLDQGPEDNIIEIHHFNGGYAGISKIENGAYCMAYLVKNEVLKKFNGNIEEMEQHVLNQNIQLKERLNSKKLFGPITTTIHHFSLNDLKHQDLIKIGDAAGFIPPITGNGMSLAFRASKNTFQSILKHQLKHDLILKDNQYYFKTYLKKRLFWGNFIQNLLTSEHEIFQKICFKTLSLVPLFTKLISKFAVGKKI